MPGSDPTRSHQYGTYLEKESPLLLITMGEHEQEQYGLSFYQILQHDFSNLLKIPQDAVRKLEIVPHKCRIKGPPAQRFWDVSVGNLGNDLYFLQGWSAFASDYSLTRNDLLTFTQCGASEFSVEVFGEDGVERVVNLTEEEETILVEEDEPVFSEPRRVKKRAKASSSCSGEEASFSVVMSASYVTGHKMTVPISFARKHLEGKQSVKLQVDESAKSWSLKVNFGRKATSIYAGWMDFAKDNDLKEGDVCNFKLVGKGNEPILDVSIVRKLCH